MKWIIWFILMILGSLIASSLFPLEIATSISMAYGFVLTTIFIHL